MMPHLAKPTTDSLVWVVRTYGRRGSVRIGSDERIFLVHEQEEAQEREKYEKEERVRRRNLKKMVIYF